MLCVVCDIRYRLRDGHFYTLISVLFAVQELLRMRRAGRRAAWAATCCDADLLWVECAFGGVSRRRQQQQRRSSTCSGAAQPHAAAAPAPSCQHRLKRRARGACRAAGRARAQLHAARRRSGAARRTRTRACANAACELCAARLPKIA
jgi:hypothetical protein